MREVGAVRIRLDGDEEAASTYVGQARTELGILKNSMAALGLKQLTRTVNLADGTTITVMSVHGQDTILITVPLAEATSAQASTSASAPSGHSVKYFYRVTGLQPVAPVYSTFFTVGVDNGQFIVGSTTPNSREPLVLAGLKAVLAAGRTDVVERFCNKYFGADCALAADTGFLLDKTAITTAAPLPKLDTIFAGYLGAFSHAAFVPPVAGAGETLSLDYSGRLDRWYTSYTTGGSSFTHTIGNINGSFLVTDSTTTIGGATRLKYRRGFTGWSSTPEAQTTTAVLNASAQAAGNPTTIVTGNTTTANTVVGTAVESYGTGVPVGEQAWTVTVIQDHDGSPHASITYSGSATAIIATDYVIARYLSRAGDSFLAYRSGRLAVAATVLDASRAAHAYAYDQTLGAAKTQDAGGVITAVGGSRANSIVNYSGTDTNYLQVSLTGFLAVIPRAAPVYADDWVGPPAVWSDVGCLYDPVSGNFAYVKYPNPTSFIAARDQFMRKANNTKDEVGTLAQYRDAALALLIVVVNTGLAPALLLGSEPGQLVLMV